MIGAHAEKLDGGPQGKPMDKPHIYQIAIGARLDKKWSSWFYGMAMTSEKDGAGLPVTVITGTVADQAALHGILAKIRDLGLPLISVKRME
jgi:hypothetical protein